MNPIHPLSVPVPPPASRHPACRPPAGRKARRRRRRKARHRCRLSQEERADFINRFSRPALGYAVRWGVRKAEIVAEAALQETLRVYRKRKGKFRPLLFKILRWRLLSAYRQQARNRIITVALVDEMDMPLEGGNPVAENLKLKSALRKAWAELEPVERRLLDLHIVQGRSFPQIQNLKCFRAQGWAVATLRSKAHRARIKLRAQLQPLREAAAET